ncbi:hypothetical protein ILYODFUR_006178 [Ilyodon furcidens]|uniref:Secreted protein n=1 Tax=Ilyodon furcidens TaxID=33524 RepID=A0ABV0TU38_9TELE
MSLLLISHPLPCFFIFCLCLPGYLFSLNSVLNVLSSVSSPFFAIVNSLFLCHSNLPSPPFQPFTDSPSVPSSLLPDTHPLLSRASFVFLGCLRWESVLCYVVSGRSWWLNPAYIWLPETPEDGERLAPE